MVLVLLGSARPLHADTVYLKEKKTLKGVVVEEQADRYILSTADGEIPVLKAVVESVAYDDPEQRYYHLGRQLQQAGQLREALSVYQKAVELRPDFQAAREAAFGVQRLLAGDEESQALAEVRQKRLIMRQQRPGSGLAASRPVTFEDRFGCSIGYDEGRTIIATVRAQGPAAVAGLRAGDQVVAVGPEPVLHLDPEAISRRFREARGEFSLTIERRLTLQRSGTSFGFGVELGYQGLRVAAVDPQGPAHGRLQMGDLITAINGRTTRYMVLAEAQKTFQRSQPLQLAIQRLILLRQRQLE